MKRLLCSFVFIYSAACAQTLSFKKVECGTEFTIGLRSDSTLWGFGQNGNGQLGTEDFPDTDTPVQLVTSNKWKDIAAGSFHTIALAADGSLWGWGLNGNGQIGNDTTYVTRQQPVAVMSGARWLSIAAGQGHSLAIKSDGTLWAAGVNATGQLGTGDTTQRQEWTQIGTDNDWKLIAAGGIFSFGIKNDGSLWAWGYNDDGELGLGYLSYSVNRPTRVGTDTNWTGVSCGFVYSLALKRDGTVWSTGFNGAGSLGRTTVDNYDSSFALIDSANNWRTISAGCLHSLGITRDGTLWGWGNNSYGQLGNSGSSSMEPIGQAGIDNNWAYIAASDGAAIGVNLFGTHSAGFRTQANALCTAGSNYIGQLGNGTRLAGTTGQTEFNCDAAMIPTSIRNLTAKANTTIAVVPNPAKEAIQLAALSGNYHYTITDLVGKAMLSGDARGSEQINVTTLGTGTYLLHVTHQLGTSAIKFVKE
jgi:alpha-tubulin suppressor-like RCC1 family protein